MTAQRTLIIAEAGVNHNGDLTEALRLVDFAAESGADIVKFQSFSAELLVTPNADKAQYQKNRTEAHETQMNMLRGLELSRSDHISIIERCRERKIGFLSTGFDLESIDMLMSLGIDRIKIPSGEITNLPYLRYVGGLGIPVIMSTGMANLEEVESALEILLAAGVEKSEITVLHCTTEYPAPMFDVNLRAMLTIKEAFSTAVGYSDHTLGHEIAIAAVALGAEVIEKHLTLNKSSAGPDHAASLKPDEFSEMVQAIRNIETALGDGTKVAQPSEVANRVVARRSIVASVDITEGETFTPLNISVKRPGSGLSPMLWDEVIGSKAKRDFEQNELIEL